MDESDVIRHSKELSELTESISKLSLTIKGSIHKIKSMDKEIADLKKELLTYTITANKELDEIATKVNANPILNMGSFANHGMPCKENTESIIELRTRFEEFTNEIDDIHKVITEWNEYHRTTQSRMTDIEKQNITMDGKIQNIDTRMINNIGNLQQSTDSAIRAINEDIVELKASTATHTDQLTEIFSYKTSIVHISAVLTAIVTIGGSIWAILTTL